MPSRRHLLNPGASTPGIRPVVVRKRPPRPCPCCGQPGGMCDDHLERLARVKAELTQGGLFSQRSDQRRVKRGPTCGAVGCLAPHRRAAGVAMTGVGQSVASPRPMVDGWRDVPQPSGVRRLPTTPNGIPISYTVMWSSEAEPVARVDPLLTAIGCDTPALCHGGEQGVGVPKLALSSVERQRRVAILGLCQVCGQKLPGRRTPPWRSSPRWLADLRNQGQEIQIGLRRVPLIVDGWTCEPCLRYALRICPGLAERRPRLLRVRDCELVATICHVDKLPDEPLVDWVKIAPTAFDWVDPEELTDA